MSRSSYLQAFLRSGVLQSRGFCVQGLLHPWVLTFGCSYIQGFLRPGFFFLRSGLLMFQGSHVKGVLHTGILTLAPYKILTTNSKVRISISCLLFTLRVNVTRHYPLFRFDQSGACACEYHVLHHSLWPFWLTGCPIHELKMEHTWNISKLKQRERWPPRRHE